MVVIYVEIRSSERQLFITPASIYLRLTLEQKISCANTCLIFGPSVWARYWSLKIQRHGFTTHKRLYSYIAWDVNDAKRLMNCRRNETVETPEKPRTFN
jgi:hypothetical protein